MINAQKLTLIIFVSIAVLLYAASQLGLFTLDINGLLNGTLQSLVAGIVLIPVTIVTYRYFYHRHQNGK